MGDKSLLKTKDPVCICGPVYIGKRNSVGQSSVAVCVQWAHGTCSRCYAGSHRVTAHSGRGAFQPHPSAVCVTLPGSDRFLIDPSVFAQAAKTRPAAHIYSSLQDHITTQMLISLDTPPHSGESANILTASKGHTAGDTTFHQRKDFNSCFFFF